MSAGKYGVGVQRARPPRRPRGAAAKGCPAAVGPPGCRAGMGRASPATLTPRVCFQADPEAGKRAREPAEVCVCWLSTRAQAPDSRADSRCVRLLIRLILAGRGLGDEARSHGRLQRLPDKAAGGGGQNPALQDGGVLRQCLDADARCTLRDPPRAVVRALAHRTLSLGQGKLGSNVGEGVRGGRGCL